MVLAAQFESFDPPLTVMLTIPLAAFGALAVVVDELDQHNGKLA